MSIDRPKVLLIGWDAADWKAIHPLMDAGKMPHLQSLVEGGMSGNLASLEPMYSPMLWTSIATGMRPYKHGIHGFVEPDPATGRTRPISSLSRKVKAIWNILTQEGYRSNVVGWWPSHPAEPINGAMVSNHFQQAGQDPNHWPMPDGTVHPERLREPLAELRVHPTEFSGNELLPFLPNLGRIDLKKDKRPVVLAKILADCVSIHSAATALMQLEPWDFMAVYFDAIDHFGHAFMRYHPPRQNTIEEEDFENYKGVIETGYRFHDQMLGALLNLAGPDTYVFLISDHGFHPDHLRPQNLPAEPAGPAIEHRPFGIFAAKGPTIQKDELLYGANLLDIAPTILSLFGLPVGEDMDGRPLTEIFANPPPVRTIPSWEKKPGEAGQHPAHAALDDSAAHAAIERLADLGYVDPDAAAGTPEAVERTRRELDYNLAQAYLDGKKPAEAAEILERIWLEEPTELRFARFLGTACHMMGRTRDCRAVVERMVEIRRELRRQARELLNALQGKDLRKGKRTEFILRKIASAAQEPPQDDGYLLGLLDFAEGNFDRAATQILAEGPTRSRDPLHHEQVGDLLVRMERYDDALQSYERALSLNPESERAWLGIAETYLLTKQWNEAAEAALRAVGLKFQMPRAHFCLGKALCGCGDFIRAEEAFRIALNQAPGMVEARRELIALYEGAMPAPAKADREKQVLQFIEDRRRERRRVPATSVIDGQIRVPDVSAARFPERPEQLLAPNTNNKDEDSPATQKREPALIVSGLPRSGTSLLMQMLDAAGIDILSDGKRKADLDNPRGYYEYEPVKRLSTDSRWLTTEAPGKAVKIVAPLLKHLPPRLPCQIIFLTRDLDEILRSQEIMIERSGKKKPATDQKLKAFLEAELSQTLERIQKRPGSKILLLEYAKIATNPIQAAEKIATFLNRKLPIEAMTAIVQPELYRNRR